MGMKSRNHLTKSYYVIVLGCILCVELFAQVSPVAPNKAPQSVRAECRSSDIDGVGVSEKDDGFVFVAANGIFDFIEKLNSVGRCGYRLVSLTKLPLYVSERFEQMTLFAVLRYSGEEAFEYDWFEAFTPGDAQTRINYRAEKGFYFREILPISIGLCDESSRSSSDKTEIDQVFERLLGTLGYSYGGIYFLERRAGVEMKNDYRVLIGTAGWGKEPTAQLELEVNESARRGYRPVAFTAYKIRNKYAFAVMAEKIDHVSETRLPEYRVFRSNSNFEKKINNLTKEGYEILLDGQLNAARLALVKKAAKSVDREYSWVDTTKKSLPKILNDLAARSVEYRGGSFRILGCDFAETRMMFAKGESHDRSVEFKTIKLAEWAKVSGTSSDRSISKKEFSRLLKEGFVFKDLFFADGVRALFERMPAGD